MRGVILAAGRGSRMGRMTDRRPKCLTVVAGQTLLAWQQLALRAGGVEDIAIVRGYRRDEIDLAGCRGFDNDRWAETNMVATLACAQLWLEREPSIVSYSDIVYHPDIVADLATHDGDVVISYDREWLALWRERFVDPCEDAETFRLGPGGRLAEIGARAAGVREIEGQYMGLFKLTPVGWRQIASILAELAPERRDRLDMTSLLQLLIDRGVEIGTIATSGRWCEVDSETDLRAYEQRLDGDAWTHDWRWQTAVSR